MKKSSYGFTLVELLTVVVLLGIVMMIAIPSLRNLTYNSSVQQYNYHEKFVEEAAKLYVKNYKSELEKDKTSTCFNIPYKALLKEDLIEEEEISCEGNIILERRSREGYNYSYFLTCRDSSGNIVHASESMPLNCKGIGGKFVLNYSLYTDGESGQVPYTEGEWTQFVYGEYNASSPYNYAVDRIEYTTDLINWHAMANRKQTYTNYNGVVFVRAVDKGGNVSEVVRHLIRTDSKVPVVSPKSNPIYIKEGQSKKILDQFNISTGLTGGTTVCKVGNTVVENINTLSFGLNDVTCTTTSGTGVEGSGIISFRHQYTAETYCDGGRTLSGGNCIYNYVNNESQCGCKTYKSCPNPSCPPVYKSCPNSSCPPVYKSCQNGSICGEHIVWTGGSVNCGPGCYQEGSCASQNYVTCKCPGYGDFGTIGWGETCPNFVEAQSCPHAACGIDHYESCRASICGVEYYQSCVSTTCGCQVGNNCTKQENSYKKYRCHRTGNNGTKGTLSGTTCSF